MIVFFSRLFRCEIGVWDVLNGLSELIADLNVDLKL